VGLGDEIVAAGQAQRIYEQYGTRVLIVDEQRRPRWHPLWEGNPVIVRPVEVSPVHRVSVLPGYRLDVQQGVPVS